MSDDHLRQQTDLLRRVRLALRDEDFPAAIGYLERTVELAREVGDAGAAGRHLGNLALIYHRVGQPEQALKHFKTALEIAEAEDDRLTMSGLLGNIGNILREVGRPAEALNYLNRAMVIANEAGDIRGRGIWFSNIGLVYDGLEQHEKAAEMHRRSVEIARKLQDQRGLAARLGNLGNTNISQGQYEASLPHFEEAVEIFRRIGEKHELALRLGILGNLHAELGRQAEDQQGRNDHFNAALTQYAWALSIAQKLGDTASQAELLRSTGNVLASAGHYEDAIKYFKAARRNFESLGLTAQVEVMRQSIDHCERYRITD
jgi:tetratricopeptide (TPR) repeat protein